MLALVGPLDAECQSHTDVVDKDRERERESDDDSLFRNELSFRGQRPNAKNIWIRMDK